MHRRTRTCIGGDAGDEGCVGLVVSTERCATMPCPQWAAWTMWTGCTKTCGSGLMYRSRTCDFGRPFEDGCDGEMEESDICNSQVGCWSVCCW